MKVLILDNYDSFTYNLVQMVEKITGKADVFRNDQISLEDVDRYQKIILSPGPGLPADAGIMLELIRRYAPTKSILGVCLGHQAIAESFGGRLLNLPQVYHGVATAISLKADRKQQQNDVFTGLPELLEAGRYHSWVVEKKSFPAELTITAEDESGEIMALQHKQYDVQGVQFHPESILTPLGNQMIANWLNGSVA